MLIAGAVVAHRAFLDALLCGVQVHHDDAVCAGRRGLDGEFERVQRVARIPAGHVRDEIQRLVGQGDRLPAVTARVV